MTPASVQREGPKGRGPIFSVNRSSTLAVSAPWSASVGRTASRVTVTGPLLEAGRSDGVTDTTVGGESVAPLHPATQSPTSSGRKRLTGALLERPPRRRRRRDGPRGDRCSPWTARAGPRGTAPPGRPGAPPGPRRRSPTP